MNMLYVQAAEFHQLPSSILIPQAPRYLRWWLDGAVLIWRTARENHEKTHPSRSPASTKAPPGLRAVGTRDDKGLIRFSGEKVPWVERDEHGRLRYTRRA